MGDKVLKTIVMKTLRAKYISLIIDLMPIISHQLIICGSPVESFLKFIPNRRHKSQQITNAVTSSSIEFGIHISAASKMTRNTKELLNAKQDVFV